MDYFLQQLINGLTLGSIYGLIAIGYTIGSYGHHIGEDGDDHFRAWRDVFDSVRLRFRRPVNRPFLVLWVLFGKSKIEIHRGLLPPWRFRGWSRFFADADLLASTAGTVERGSAFIVAPWRGVGYPSALAPLISGIGMFDSCCQN